MAAPHYIAQKVGDQYVLVRKDPCAERAKSGLLIGGAITACVGLFHHGSKRRVLISTGGALLLTGLILRAQKFSGRASSSKVRRFTRGPSYQNENEGLKPRQKPIDDVEEASMESFPASDPPASAGSSKS